MTPQMNAAKIEGNKGNKNRRRCFVGEIEEDSKSLDLHMTGFLSCSPNAHAYISIIS